MKVVAILMLTALGACAHVPFTSHNDGTGATLDTRLDSLYWNAVQQLDPANKNGSLDAGVASLDAYLASAGELPHRREAAALRMLARNSQQLARVEMALQQARSENKADSKGAARDDETVKEVQRLRDELTKANEELERIKKRLAAPKP